MLVDGIDLEESGTARTRGGDDRGEARATGHGGPCGCEGVEHLEHTFIERKGGLEPEVSPEECPGLDPGRGRRVALQTVEGHKRADAECDRHKKPSDPPEA